MKFWSTVPDDAGTVLMTRIDHEGRVWKIVRCTNRGYRLFRDDKRVSGGYWRQEGFRECGEAFAGLVQPRGRGFKRYRELAIHGQNQLISSFRVAMGATVALIRGSRPFSRTDTDRSPMTNLGSPHFDPSLSS
jgi:hypothetical protein